jgi:hypothetical protein
MLATGRATYHQGDKNYFAELIDMLSKNLAF